MKNKFHKNGYLKEAKRILNLAKKEYNVAKETKNEMKARQAAEKGYLCLLKTVNALLVAKGVNENKVPKVEKGRFYFLSKYADREFRKDYSALRHLFHIDAFYEGLINYKILDEGFEDLEKLVKKVEEIWVKNPDL